jgi:hypothetical protein
MYLIRLVPWIYIFYVLYTRAYKSLAFRCLNLLYYNSLVFILSLKGS